MIHTLYIINSSGECVFQRHYRSHCSKKVVDEFWSHVMAASSAQDVIPVIATPTHYLIHILRGGLFFLAVQSGETPPLMTTELLERIANLFDDYFGGISEELLKDNFVVAYELLEELCDSGFPVTTEPTVLKDLVAPPSVVGSLKNIIGASNHLSTTADSLENSPVPWRKKGVKHAPNEIAFDTMEELDCIIDQNGNILSSECYGSVQCTSRLSGMPDVLLTFNNPAVIDDISFHPCVRCARYEQDRSLSFVPPDGAFELLRYRSDFNSPAPFYVTPKISFHKDHGRVNIIIGCRGGGVTFPQKGIQDFMVAMKCPDNTVAARLEPSDGKYTFDANRRILRWDVGKLQREKSPTLTGTLICQSGTEFPDSTPHCLVNFTIPGQTLSGLKIDTVGVVNEKYKPFKGMRSLTQAGSFEVRTC